MSTEVLLIIGVVVALAIGPIVMLTALGLIGERGRHRADDLVADLPQGADTEPPANRMQYACSCGWTCVDDSGDLAGFDDAVFEHMEQHRDGDD